jgi:hypothetical protein
VIEFRTPSLSGATSCGEALRNGRRVIVPDVETCELIVDVSDIVANRRSGIRGVQSTPLISRSGRLLGMLSTHWRRPHRPSERDLRLIDVLARQAAGRLALGIEGIERLLQTFLRGFAGIDRTAHVAADVGLVTHVVASVLVRRKKR